jgi:hypothetical protein
MARFTNKVHTRSSPREVIDVRKVPADSVPYGSDISRNGRTVWAAYHADERVAVAATAPEARRKYREVMSVREKRVLIPTILVDNGSHVG